MKILGINAFGHDTSAALLVDGKLIAAVEEERLNREKCTRAFPHRSISYCLEAAGIKLSEVDYIGYAYKPMLWLRDRFFYHQLRYFPYALPEIRYAHRAFGKFFGIRHNIRKELGVDIPIKLIKHHDAHLASTYFVSGFDRSAVLTLDGLGEYETSVGAIGRGQSIERLDKINFPYSLGAMYACISHFVGYQAELDEGKVMGLAAYGDPSEYYNSFRKILSLNKNGTFSLDMSYFSYHLCRDKWVSDKFYKIFGPRREKGGEMTQRHINVAAAAQKVLEDAVLHRAEWLFDKTREKNLCLAGGVALNSVANGKIEAARMYENIYVQPASGDSGLPIGVVYSLYNKITELPKSFFMSHPYLGPQYSAEDCLKAIEKFELKYTTPNNISEAVAKALSEGKVVGLHQGRMEIGPRALGNRSILADPRNAAMKDIVNEKVKFREGYRPFAPAVTEERVGEYFDIKIKSPFMLIVSKAVDGASEKIPAVVHSDGTGRIQTVNREDNPVYYDIIHKFGELTNVPVVLNTSFNIKDEPIVCTPEDAIKCFLGTNIDALALGKYLLIKSEQRE